VKITYCSRAQHFCRRLFSPLQSEGICIFQCVNASSTSPSSNPVPALPDLYLDSLISQLLLFRWNGYCVTISSIVFWGNPRSCLERYRLTYQSWCSKKINKKNYHYQLGSAKSILTDNSSSLSHSRSHWNVICLLT